MDQCSPARARQVAVGKHPVQGHESVAMADDTASLVQFYARAGAGGSITLEKRVEASWDAACPGQEILHGTQYIGTVADPAALGSTMKGKLDTMDAAAHNYACELNKDHPDSAVVKDRRETQRPPPVGRR